MNLFRSKCAFAALVALLLLGGSSLPGQTAGLKGRVTDPSGAAVPGARVRVRNQAGREVRVNSNEQGVYEFKTLIPGAYTVTAQKEGFANSVVEAMDIRTALNFDIQMTLAAAQQVVDVQEEVGKVATDQASNAGQLILTGDDLKVLSDDPDTLASELQALAGPGAGPNGGQIFIDGFSGGRLPPKSSIREIRINQNPFSPEFDRIGFGRIEILTKPGQDKFRGDAFFNFSDNVFNARNPFSPTKPDFLSRLFGGRISGALNKKTSYALDVESRLVDDNVVTNGTALDAQLRPFSFQQSFAQPQRRIGINPRIDYAINDRHTLVARYGFQGAGQDNLGLGNFAVASRAFNANDRDHTLQLTETAILSATAINESRLQFIHSRQNQFGDNTLPAIEVLDAFSGGGAQIGRAFNTSKSLEYSNITTMTKGTHSVKFGGRVRWNSLSDNNPNNFGGTFTFTGGPGPALNAANQPTGATEVISSLERYRRTLLFQQQGLPMSQIRTLGGGASQFSLNGGNPLAAIRQSDFGFFLNDDWRARPNLTFSYGLRYENQTNISSHANFAPRIALAWGVDGGKTKQAKTVLRIGSGIFYDRVAQNLALQALRFNGVTQLQFLVPQPDFFPNIPSLNTLSGNRLNQALRVVDNAITAPLLWQNSIGLDRQLPKNTSVSVNYVFSRGVHDLRQRNINFPVNGVRPFGDVGNLFLFESTGFSRTNQLRANFSTRMKRGFLFGVYSLGFNRSDTDGIGSQPANPFDIRSEWGRASFDTRHFMIMGGSLNLPRGISLNPFVIYRTGGPVNITTGRDNNGDQVFNDRPSLVTDGRTGANIVATQYGVFNLTPGPNEAIIARNFANGPDNFNLNLRASRTWGFGKRGESGPGDGVMPPGMRTGDGPGGGGGGPRGGMGGPPPGAMSRSGGPGGMFGGAATGKRFNLTTSIQASNLLNRVNYSPWVGNLASPLFGQSLQLGGGFGGFGRGGGGGGGGPFGGSASNNRRLELQLRFSF